ncbi:MAG: winged helix-turn-helix transcriptional regulator [Firmicutes bacterium]|nr:winged helix-turn-helix transcriptional regulator [Bacillota bacterium]
MGIYEMRADLAKALAHPLRLEILGILLTEGETCVCEITDKVGAQQPTVSKHLSVLRDAGILTSRKDGLMVFYDIRVPCIQGFFDCLDRVLEEDLRRRQAHLEEGGHTDE